MKGKSLKKQKAYIKKLNQQWLKECILHSVFYVAHSNVTNKNAEYGKYHNSDLIILLIKQVKQHTYYSKI